MLPCGAVAQQAPDYTRSSHSNVPAITQISLIDSRSLTATNTQVCTKEKKNNSTFSTTSAAGKPQPNQTPHGDRGPHARSCVCKMFSGKMHSFATRNAENLREPEPSNLSPK